MGYSILPRNTPNSQNLLLRCPPADSSLGGYGILPYPRRLLWDILPQNSQNSQNLLLRRASHGFHRFTQILRVRCSPTEFTEFTEFGSVGMAGMPYPPISVNIRANLWEALLCQKFLCVPCVLWESLSSHGFLLRRVWHLAIPTPPAMGYSPTEYAEFTEPPTEMSSHGFHRFTQILRVRCSPTEFGSVGMAGMPYPPNLCSSVLICGRLFSARGFCAFRAFCGNLFPPTDFTDLHRYLGCAVLPQNSQNTQNLSAWVWQGCHTLLHL